MHHLEGGQPRRGGGLLGNAAAHPALQSSRLVDGGSSGGFQGLHARLQGLVGQDDLLQPGAQLQAVRLQVAGLRPQHSASEQSWMPGWKKIAPLDFPEMDFSVSGACGSSAWDAGKRTTRLC